MSGISYLKIFKIWKQNRKISAIEALNSIENKPNFDERSSKFIENSVKNLFKKFAVKWVRANRTESNFLRKNSEWLNTEIQVPADPVILPKKRGRPTKGFDDSSVKSKRRKVQNIIENFSPNEITFAAQKSLQSQGKRSGAQILKKIDSSPANISTCIKKSIESPPKTPVKYSKEEALALYINGKFTKSSYSEMRQGAKERNADIYPSYNKIKEAKVECYPPSKFVKISETSAEIALQALLDHTATRILISIRDKISASHTKFQNGFILYCKWGLDGSSGHSTFKQKWSNSSDSTTPNDGCLVGVCLVPLLLKANSNLEVWKNDVPGSTRYCRPIKLIFAKETFDLLKRETENVERQIKKLKPLKVKLENCKHTFEIRYHLKLTMIDGKAAAALTDVSTQKCFACEASPSMMNDLASIFTRQVNIELCDLGLSILHCWIRTLDNQLSVSYRLPLQKWRIYDDEEKEQVAIRKKFIQDELKKQLGLLIDIPKSGMGTTNDGNTARRFFENYKVVAKVTGLDEQLLKRFWIILKVLSSAHPINIPKFKEYCRETAELYVKLYKFYPMSPTIHKYLVHGVEFIKSGILPIGSYTEEAQEALNKKIKYYRMNHTRKISRQQTMVDMMHALLQASDPLISSLSKVKPKIHDKSKMCEEALQLLDNPPSLDSCHEREVEACVEIEFFDDPDYENNFSDDSESEL